MPFQKGHPKPALKAKNCIICGKEFKPTSGAQKTCSDVCKAKQRMQQFLERKKKKNEDHEGETREERMARLDRENPIPERKKTYRLDEPKNDVPELELDLTPLEDWIKVVVQRGQQKGSAGLEGNAELEEFVRRIVREELAERLRPLLGSN